MFYEVLSLMSLLATSAVAETVHGIVVFTRHGDRTTKHYGAQSLTSLGAMQNFQVGSAYRERYLAAGSPQRIFNISEFNYVSSQMYATAPNQGILLNTATAFLQGLYPPLVDIDAPISSQTLNNGSESVSPLDGYQYVTLQGVSTSSPDTIWIKGDDACPVVIEASKSFEDSAEFADRVESTRDFYKSFFPVLQSVYDYESADELSYSKAYDIFDLINVARIYNATSLARNVSDEDLFQLRTLADSAEFGYNYNKSQPERSIHAETLNAAILRQMNQTVVSKAKLKFSLLSGSYDTLLAFFGRNGLTEVDPNFFGLPEYASTIAFELFSPETMDSFPSDPDDSLRVRFLFRNGTLGEFNSFPLFGTGDDTLSWPDFVSNMQSRAITTTEKWCQVCKSEVDFCAMYTEGGIAATSKKGGMSNAVAGVIGAMVTLGVVALVGALVFLLLRKRRASGTPAPAATVTTEKGSTKSGSEGGSNV